MYVIGCMAPKSASRVSPPRRWSIEILKLAAACASGFAIASWLTEKKELPSTAGAPTPAILPAAKSSPAVSHPLPSHMAAAARVAKALELARTDEAGLLRRLEKATDPGERRELIRGLFAHLAHSLSPPDAIRKALTFEGADQDTALKELAAVWLGTDPEKIAAGRAGSSAVLHAGLALIYSKDARPGAAEAWVAAFHEHPARLELTAALAGVLATTDPQRALTLAEGFTAWERQRFHEQLLLSWASQDPDAARRWQTDPSSGSSGLRFPWNTASYQHPEWVAKALAAERDPATRLDIIRSMASEIAFKGTREALAWAESLTNPAERDLAHDRIYEATPRGIGAVLSSTDGFSVIRSVLPDSAAARAGLQAGDRFLEVTGTDGKTVSLYQQPVEFTAKQLHGEAGEPVDLHILRNGPDGKPLELTVRIVRDQLVFPADMAKAEK